MYPVLVQSALVASSAYNIGPESHICALWNTATLLGSSCLNHGLRIKQPHYRIMSHIVALALGVWALTRLSKAQSLLGRISVREAVSAAAVHAALKVIVEIAPLILRHQSPEFYQALQEARFAFMSDGEIITELFEGDFKDICPYLPQARSLSIAHILETDPKYNKDTVLSIVWRIYKQHNFLSHVTRINKLWASDLKGSMEKITCLPQEIALSIAQTLEQESKYDEALLIYRGCDVQGADCARILLKMSSILIDQRKYDEAKQHISMALDYSDDATNLRRCSAMLSLCRTKGAGGSV